MLPDNGSGYAVQGGGMAIKRKIFVTKSFMPPREEFFAYLTSIYENGQLTNGGPMLLRLEQDLKKILEAPCLRCLGNGTLALHLALKALDITEGEIITTPFSYVATVTSILWERCTPVFVDIEPDNFTLNPELIEARITKKTRAILPVHVFGYACKVDQIREIAERHGLKVIYDGAHAFGSRYKGRSLLTFGDITTCSFHATKIFHTVEGGACITGNHELDEKIDLLRRFGHTYDDYFLPGTNAKMSEMHAAMGLANLPHLDLISWTRKDVTAKYDERLRGVVQRPKEQPDLEYNHAYYPVLFNNERELLAVMQALNTVGVYPRRYFYPCLTRLPYLTRTWDCPTAEDVASRILCLPLFAALHDDEIDVICEVIRNTVGVDFTPFPHSVWKQGKH